MDDKKCSNRELKKKYGRPYGDSLDLSGEKHNIGRCSNCGYSKLEITLMRGDGFKVEEDYRILNVDD